MLRSIKEITGYRLAAKDGSIGKAKDLLFDQEHWTVRWIVADTGTWLPKKKVLISPVSLGKPDWEASAFPVRLTKEEVESSPPLSSDEPVSRQYERRFFEQYSWPYYWYGANVWGPAALPYDLFETREIESHEDISPESGSDVLRSTEEVSGYHVQALDDEVGHVHDLVMDDDLWSIRYIVVDTKHWLSGRKVLIAPDWIKDIEWSSHKLSVIMTRKAIEESPPYESNTPIDKQYEERLYDYYGRPAYW